MQTGNKIFIVGIGANGRESLTGKGLKEVRQAQILIGANRVLSEFRSSAAKKIHISFDIEKILETIEENRDKRIVILGSGDPNHFGISKKILERFQKEDVEIVPNVSSMQLAFAAIKEPMDGALITSVHGRGMEGLLESVSAYEKIGIYTDPENNPARVASKLLENGINKYTVYICEDLGTKDERVLKSRLSGITKRVSSPLNIMILIRDQGTPNRLPQTDFPLILGIPDEDLSHAGGMITKRDIRLMTLARLKLNEGQLLWDIGAGSGSISIEGAGLLTRGMVYAVEKNKGQVLHIQENIRRFSRKNIKVYEGEAPDILCQVPDPDRVFIGGSGGRLKDILLEVIKRLRPGGIVTVNAVTTATLTNTVQILKEHNFKVEITSVNIAKSRVLGDTEILDPMTPTFIITGERLEG